MNARCANPRYESWDCAKCDKESSMQKFRKRPVVIEAERWMGERNTPGVCLVRKAESACAYSV